MCDIEVEDLRAFHVESTQAWHEVWLLLARLGEYRNGESAPEALRRILLPQCGKPNGEGKYENEYGCIEHDGLLKSGLERGMCPHCQSDDARKEGALEMRKLIQKKMRDYAEKLSKKSREDMEFLADDISDAEDWSP